MQCFHAVWYESLEWITCLGTGGGSANCSVKVKCNVKYMCSVFMLCGMKDLSGLHAWGRGRV